MTRSRSLGRAGPDPACAWWQVIPVLAALAADGDARTFSNAAAALGRLCLEPALQPAAAAAGAVPALLAAADPEAAADATFRATAFNALEFLIHTAAAAAAGGGGGDAVAGDGGLLARLARALRAAAAGQDGGTRRRRRRRARAARVVARHRRSFVGSFAPAVGF